jgi:hypothetical protein
MPLAHLIFFPEPRELTEAQIEEARALGHLREDPAAPDVTGSGGVTLPPRTAGAGEQDEDRTDEQGA